MSPARQAVLVRSEAHRKGKPTSLSINAGVRGRGQRRHGCTRPSGGDGAQGARAAGSGLGTSRRPRRAGPDRHYDPGGTRRRALEPLDAAAIVDARAAERNRAGRVLPLKMRLSAASSASESPLRVRLGDGFKLSDRKVQSVTDLGSRSVTDRGLDSGESNGVRIPSQSE